VMVYFKIRVFLVVSVQVYSTHTRGVGEGEGILELILFVTSAGAINLCLALAHHELAERGKKDASWVHSGPRCIRLELKLGSGSALSRMGGCLRAWGLTDKSW
jgi:hypothetical protein